MDLTFLGMPTCFAYVAPDFDIFFLTSAGFGSGRAETSLAVPNISDLSGAVILQQALSLDPGVNALGVSASNQLDWTIGV